MEAARPGSASRRLSRGGAEPSFRPRLVRVGLLAAAPAILALLFAVSTPGTLPPPPFEPLFDGAAAADLAGRLTTEYPARIPGTPEGEGAAFWYRETANALGLRTDEDTWTADIPDLGRVTLRNVVSVVPGRSDESVVVIAHRDNAGAGQPTADNAAGTAALIELARGFAPRDGAPSPRPQRTLVFVSTDAGIYGGEGALRFGETSPYARAAVAAVVLDGLGGDGHPELRIAGDVPVTSSRALVGTATARIEERTGSAPALPSLATQLVDLGIPFASDEQGRLLARGVATITLSTSGHRGALETSGGLAAAASVERLERLGRAVESLVDSLDISVGAPFRTADTLYVSGRAVSGWAVRLTLVLLVVPFALAVVDLLARARRRRVAFAPAVRGLATRVVIWLLAAFLVGMGALTDVFPTGAALPLPPFSEYVTQPRLAGLGVLAITFAGGWFLCGRRLAPAGSVPGETRLAGLVVGLAGLGVVSLVVAITRPFALVFVIPSLYAWLWIQPEAPAWRRVALFALGLAGPLLGLALLGRELGLGPIETPLYAVGLVTVGYVSLGSTLLAVAWAAAAAQVGAVAFGRYGPYSRNPRQAVRARGLAARLTGPLQSSDK